jgi:hypothetical protein
MQSSYSRRFVLQTLALTSLIAIVLGVVGILKISLQPLASVDDLLISTSGRVMLARSRTPTPAGDLWATRFASAPAPLTRTVTVSATNESGTLYFDLWLTNTHPVAIGIMAGELEPLLPQSFVDNAFGEIDVNNRALLRSDFSAPRWTLDNSNQLLHVQLVATKRLVQSMEVSINRLNLAASLAPERDEFIIKVSGLRIASVFPKPDEVDLAAARLSRTIASPLSYLNINLVSLTNAPDNAPQSGVESTREFLSRITDVPLLGAIAYGFNLALPLILFLYTVRRNAAHAPERARRLSRVGVALLVFHFLVWSGNGINALFYRVPLVANFLTAAAKSLSSYFIKTPRLDLVSVAVGLGPAVFGVLVPAYVLGQVMLIETHPSSRSRRTINLWDAIPVILGGTTLGAFIYSWLIDNRSLQDTPTWILLIGIVPLLTLALGILLNLVYRLVTAHFPSSSSIWISAFLILGVEGLNAITGGGGPYQLIWLIISIIGGACLLIALARLFWTHVLDLDESKHALLRQRWIVWLAGMILVIPLGYVVSSRNQLATESTIFSLAFRLDEFVIYVWLTGIVILLAQDGNEGLPLSQFTREVGILAVSTLLFGVTAYWNYIPVTFLVGLYLLRRLIRPVAYWYTLKPLLHPVLTERLDLLEQILNLNAAESAYREVRSKATAKLSSGDLTIDQYEQQLNQLKLQLDGLREEATIAGRPAKEVALTFGPFQTAWANAMHGLKWSLLFVTPWFVLSLRDYLGVAFFQGQEYPFLRMAADLLIFVSKWGVFGFCLGYFYPFLWGENGLKKGFGLFLVTIGATLPLWTIFNATAIDWQASLFYALQVFIQCMMLGLFAFDYYTLRQGRYDWKILFQIHGLTPVSVSISTILAAVGVTITTLLTSQATNLVTLALKYVLPVLPNNIPVLTK